MLGLTFQDDAPSFDEGLGAFINGLGEAAAGGRQNGEARSRRHEIATPHHLRFEHHPFPLSNGQRGRARQIGAESDRAATLALKQIQSRLASLACAFGLEIADADTVSTVG
jgi:hypothetical protein